MKKNSFCLKYPYSIGVMTNLKVLHKMPSKYKAPRQLTPMNISPTPQKMCQLEQCPRALLGHFGYIPYAHSFPRFHRSLSIYYKHSTLYTLWSVYAQSFPHFHSCIYHTLLVFYFNWVIMIMHSQYYILYSLLFPHFHSKLYIHYLHWIMTECIATLCPLMFSELS